VLEPPSGEGWIHEIKYDGYRTLIVIDRGQVRAFTRNGNDWTRAYRRVVDACGKLACETALIDGEMVVQDEHGITDFYALRSAIYTAPHRLVFFAFDLLHLDGQDLRGQPLMERRALLRKLVKQDPAPRSSSAIISRVTAPGSLRLRRSSGSRASCPRGQRAGIAAGPSRSWLKTKNMVESEFILLGTERDSDGVPWALLATDRDGHLAFAGPAILNPPQALRAAWRERMAALAVTKPLVRGLRQGTAQWLRPELRVRVRLSRPRARCDTPR
jgi:bifunctional non-homologous end joining protein LigD